MKYVKKYYSFMLFLVISCLAFHQAATAQDVLSPKNKILIVEFEKKAKDYSKLREQIEEKLPKLPKDATAEQIETHKINFQKAVQSARAGAKQADLFTTETSKLIRKIIKNEYKGKDRVELRQTVLEADTKGVPLKINFPYPDSKEQVEMSPALLLALPQLPKQLRYRFVGRNLLLLDRENALIIDFMPDAVP